MLKKIVSIVVSATLVLATLGVSAATVGTTSTFEGDSIKVITTVQGAATGDVYTYLAYKNTVADVAGITDGDVVYVEEKTSVSGENVVFEYTTLAANNDAVVLVGGAASTENGPAQNVIEAEALTVLKDYSVTVDGVSADKKLDVTNVTSSSLVTIEADLANKVIKSVTLNGAEFTDYIQKDDGLQISYSAIAEEETVAFEITTMTGAVAESVILWNGAYVEDGDGIIAVA